MFTRLSSFIEADVAKQEISEGIPNWKTHRGLRPVLNRAIGLLGRVLAKDVPNRSLRTVFPV